MQFSESWLRQYVNPDLTTEELSHALTMAGLEVEETRPLAPPFSQVVVAEILEATQHPDADRLRVCKVNAGGDVLQIVCGAPNARPGIRIPCALVGAQLPPAEEGGKPFAIKLGKLRGVESQGMLCSGNELGVPQEADGIMELPADAPIGANIRDYLKLDDTIFVIKLTPNKADCLSILGVAREVAAITGAKLCVPEIKAQASSIQDKIKVAVESSDLCGRFAGRVIKGVNAKAKTPDWMVRCLEGAGQRSISALVDISNYAMLAIGQPTHVFDLQKIKGDLTVRWGRDGEELELLNGQTVSVAPLNGQGVGVIADANGVESVAGIMGGNPSSVTLDTQDIYLESAFWWPTAIQGRARRFNFSTDAAHRFERGVDPAGTVDALEFVSGLITQICGGQLGPVDDQVINLPKRADVRLRVARAQKVIGVPLTADVIAGLFDRIGLQYQREGNEAFVVKAPSYRFDIEIEEDLIEEVARLYGFENIPANPPVAEQRMQGTNEARRGIHKLRHAIAARGYQEVLNFGFIDADTEEKLAGNTNPIKVLNPIASQLSVMRSNLIGGLVQNLRQNLNRKASRVRLFEVGRVFNRNPEAQVGELSIAGYDQPIRVAGLAYGPALPEQWGTPSRSVDFFDVKGDLEALLAPLELKAKTFAHPALHPGRSAELTIKKRGKEITLGFVGELHPRLQQSYDLPGAPVVFEIDWAAIQDIGLPTISPISKFPAVTRDLAVVVDQSVSVAQLLDAMKAAKQLLVKKIDLFDEFKPSSGRMGGMAENEKSLAFRLTLSDESGTLQDAQIEPVISALLDAMSVKCKARIR
ncbi:phenylalanine--tRNA ligase subunit beta [Polynucleobacter victoriensis]|uniref:Phenylalanine--tRNA ligase beta subunit n=1 Tax=Polynucleobacter victoriensis TaxID=2049319 RepID=A0A212U1V4_9BURK|nr:phenylalanine--tRNA ligase subunit beta [Polynucleobacter victoriensis]SNC72101.1 phenylalanyl-tRNA synthetase beta subunit [Polynucleobacter victoriensis]